MSQNYGRRCCWSNGAITEQPFLFYYNRNVAFSNLRLQPQIVAFPSRRDFLKARSILLAGCPESNFRNNGDMLLQIVNRCLSSEITALAIGFRLRAFYDRGEKVGILAT